MARVGGIKRLLPLYGISESQIREIVGAGDLIGVIGRMEEHLHPDIVRQTLDSCGCLGSREYRRKLEEMGKELAGKDLKAKLEHINNAGSGAERVAYNADGTLTVTMRYMEGKKHGCACSASVRKGVKVSDLASGEGLPGDSVMPLTYCLCCAGAFRRHLQLQLGVDLQAKGIVSSPINSRGEKPCEFLLEIVN